MSEKTIGNVKKNKLFNIIQKIELALEQTDQLFREAAVHSYRFQARHTDQLFESIRLRNSTQINFIFLRRNFDTK